MGKVVARIRRKRLDHWWYYRTDEAFPSREAWREGGHLLEGVDIKFDGVNERSLKTGGYMKRCGWLGDGTMELVQNEIEDYLEHLYIDGQMNFAFQTGDQLFIFRYRILPGGRVLDNRLGFSVQAPPTYGELRNKAEVKIAGFVTPPLEVYRIAGEVKVTNGVLRFDKKAQVYKDSATANDLNNE